MLQIPLCNYRFTLKAIEWLFKALSNELLICHIECQVSLAFIEEDIEIIVIIQTLTLSIFIAQLLMFKKVIDYMKY